MDCTQFVDFIKRKWRVITIVLAILFVAVIALTIFGLPAEITHSSGAVTYYTNNSTNIV